jgi:excisionase family DNA binding protein
VNIVLVAGGAILLVLCSRTYKRGIQFKRTSRAALIALLFSGLLLTTLVYAADVEARASTKHANARGMLAMLQIAGIGFMVVGTCGLLSKLRPHELWMPQDPPFESYQPYKPAYTPTFPISPIVTPPIYEHSTLTLVEAARYLRISEHDVLQLIDEGSIIAVRRGSTYLVTRRALNDFARAEQLGL